MDPFWPVFPGLVPSMEGPFPPFSLLRLPSPLPLTLPPVMSCPFGHRGKPGALSACGVRVLSSVCWCVSQCFSWQSVPSLPVPAGSRLYAPPCCVRSAPIHRRAVLPVLVPSVALTVSRCRPFLSPFFPLCSGADSLRCRGFPQLSLYRVESDRLPSCRLASRPGVRPLCRCCPSVVLVISGQYKSR